MMFTHARLLRKLPAIAVSVLLGMAGADAQQFPETVFEKAGEEYRLTVGELPWHYFGFQHSTDLQSFSTIGMALGVPAPTFSYVPAAGETRGFFRAEAISGWSPGDVDNDGIDDLWELLNDLNPLDPLDANLPSSMHAGMTNLECYRFMFGLTRVTEFYSVETSVYNRPFAISVEASVYNFPNETGFSIEALSAETTVYNSPNFTGASLEAVSTELSIFNTPLFTGPSLESHSVEVSLFNTAPFTGPVLEAVSPEISVFNSFATTPALQAISFEVSVLKSTP